MTKDAMIDRLTLRIPEAILVAVKLEASATGNSMASVIKRALASYYGMLPDQSAKTNTQ